MGPPPAIVDLGRWAAWRYAGRLRPLLVAASPPSLVRALGPASERRPPPAGTTTCLGGDTTSKRALEGEIAAATVQALSGLSAVLRLPPAAPRLAAVEAAAEATADSDGDMLVLAASRADAVTLAARLERAGHAVALQPEAWAQAASGGRIVVGARSAVLAPVACLRAVVVLDAHADSYQEQRVPTWQAAVLATERARRAGIPCLLVSSCPTLELLAGRRLVTLSRDAERSGWAPVELIDARDEDPRAGGYPTRLATLIREAVAAEPAPPRPGGAQPERSRSPLGMRSLPEPASLRGVRHGPRSARTALPGRASRASLPEVRVVGPGGVLVVWADPAADRQAWGRPGPRRPRRAHRSRRRRDRPPGGRSEPLRRACARRDRGGATPRGSASLVVFLDFDHELLAPRYRAGEQALSLLALASRVVGGRRRHGRVAVRTRLPDHEVLAAALHADPGMLVAAEEPRRALLRLPPATALALVSGEGADEFVARLRSSGGAVEVGGQTDGHFLVRRRGRTRSPKRWHRPGLPPVPASRSTLARCELTRLV